MTIRGARKSVGSWAEPDLFGDSQGDLFAGAGAAAPDVYAPKPEHVRNSLASMLKKMQAAESWPWPPSMVRLHKEQTFAYLCALLPDAEEARDWQEKIATETARLSAAETAA